MQTKLYVQKYNDGRMTKKIMITSRLSIDNDDDFFITKEKYLHNKVQQKYREKI
jgi:hypothetical protein